MDHDAGKHSYSPTSLTLADAARLLTRAGGQPVTVDMLKADLAAGAPANADGTINLVHYGAWLVREMSSRD
jgi:hypothetical protein